jgi:ubiquinone/menaquinone biosynthesis C-methylase UbiE
MPPIVTAAAPKAQQQPGQPTVLQPNAETKWVKARDGRAHDLSGDRAAVSDIVSKLAHRGRGLDKLELRVGPVCRQIEARLIGARRKIRLLELGCGYGVVLMQLRRRFQDQVQLIGTNRERSHGNADAMVAAALLRNVYAAAEIRSITLPAITYWDASRELPFDNCCFDLVVSQMCIPYVPDKILFLREAARVLRKDGIGLIHTPLDHPTMPTFQTSLLEIWDQGAQVKFADYLGGCKGQTAMRLGYHSCVRLSHSHDFGADLALVCAIPLNEIFADWIGVKSLYRRN